MQAKEVIVRQLKLLELSGAQEPIEPIEPGARTELLVLMARILVVVFQTEGGRANDRGYAQSQDQA
jgi:hypothetical protein